MADERAKLHLLARVGEVFTPGGPINSYDLFAGRLNQVREVINAVWQRGTHAVLYGERGVGKTSLANVLAEVFSGRDHPLHVVATNCGTTDDFTAIWDRLFGDLGLNGRDPQGSFGRALGPEDVRRKLEKLDHRVLVVIDELDRLEDDDALTLLADTIKALSDYSVLASVMLVGVADSIDELVGDHRSVERALVQVQMPRMSPPELMEIMDKNLAPLEMTIEDSAKERIAHLSEGLPFYTHLLGRDAAQAAIADDRRHVQENDVDRAIRSAVDQAQHSIRSAYERATQSPRRVHLFREVLLACALAPKTEMGFFTARGVRAPLSRIMGAPYEIPAFARHLNEFSDLHRGPVLEKRGTTRRHFYRFENPLLQPFVILKGLSDGLVTEQVITELQDQPSDPVPEPSAFEQPS